MAKSERQIYLFSVLLLLFLAAFSLNAGPSGLTLLDLMKKDDRAWIVLFDLRLPRLFGAMLSGIALSLSGLLLQGAAYNDLASPNILGINAASGFMILAVLAFFPSLSAFSLFAAFLGALLALSLVLLLSSLSFLESSSLILGGIAVNAFFNALNTGICSLKENVLPDYAAFMAGSFSGLSFESLLFPALVIFLSVVLTFYFLPDFALLALREELSSALGLPVRRTRHLAILLSALLAASAVSISGLIGFVGLIIPHLSRLLVGENLKKRAGLCLLLGPSLLLAADTAARTLFSPSELSSGIFTSVVGVPFLVSLLLRRKHG